MRTYYCVEMGVASYPVNEIRAYTRQPTDPLTRKLCLRIRANSIREAAKIAHNRLMDERHEAIIAVQGGVY
jgi:hypothetical protein